MFPQKNLARKGLSFKQNNKKKELWKEPPAEVALMINIWKKANA